MTKVEITAVFYDMIHYKDKIKSVFAKWDEKHYDDPRGALVAGIQECSEPDLINLLINIQHLADGYEKIQELVTLAEQQVVDGEIARKKDDTEEDMDFDIPAG